ncbi:MAG: hypothetical protein AAF962_26320 [Actinomycetota bacterium]
MYLTLVELFFALTVFVVFAVITAFVVVAGMKFAVRPGPVELAAPPSGGGSVGYCTSCGRGHAQDHRFCAGCGHPLVAHQARVELR